jgi:hypothetical protein
MTRDEALKRARSRGFTSSANDWIGLFEDLGMLELEDPVEKRLITIIRDNPRLDHIAPVDVLNAIALAGLKLVDAK